MEKVVRLGVNSVNIVYDKKGNIPDNLGKVMALAFPEALLWTPYLVISSFKVSKAFLS